MPNLDTLHNELRLRLPNKSYEFYNDALRWAVDYVCRKTSMWQVPTIVTTKAGQDIYDIDLPTSTVIHSTLYIIQKGAVNPTTGKKASDVVVKRPINGFKVYDSGSADYLKSFKTNDKESVQIFPTPKEGGKTLEIWVAIKPTKGAEAVDNEELFEEYPDTLVYGAMHRLYQLENNIEQAEYNNQAFKNGVDSIHTDVLKQKANTPMKVSSAW